MGSYRSGRNSESHAPFSHNCLFFTKFLPSETPVLSNVHVRFEKKRKGGGMSQGKSHPTDIYK